MFGTPLLDFERRDIRQRVLHVVVLKIFVVLYGAEYAFFIIIAKHNDNTEEFSKFKLNFQLRFAPLRAAHCNLTHFIWVVHTAHVGLIRRNFLIVMIEVCYTSQNTSEKMECTVKAYYFIEFFT